MSLRIGADVGGTFTDVVLEADGALFSTKVLTTYDAPERGVLDLQRAGRQAQGHRPAQGDGQRPDGPDGRLQRRNQP